MSKHFVLLVFWVFIHESIVSGSDEEAVKCECPPPEKFLKKDMGQLFCGYEIGKPSCTGHQQAAFLCLNASAVAPSIGDCSSRQELLGHLDNDFFCILPTPSICRQKFPELQSLELCYHLRFCGTAEECSEKFDFCGFGNKEALTKANWNLEKKRHDAREAIKN